MSESPEALLWQRRWAPAQEWGTLVLSLEFRQDAVRYFFCDGPSLFESSNTRTQCPCCTKWRHQDCLFFHPTLSKLFLDLIQSYDHMRYRCTNEYLNSELLERLLRILPVHFAQLGCPCPNGRLWECVVDKLELLFPREVFMMFDIRHMLQKKEVENQLYYRYGKIKKGRVASSDLSPRLRSRYEHLDSDNDCISLFLFDEPTCSCRFYYEGDCPLYKKFIEGKAIHSSSDKYASVLTRKLDICEYVDAVNEEFDSDWEHAPVCAQLRLRTALHKVYMQRMCDNKAQVAAINAAKKEKSAKYKTRLRNSIVLIP